MYDDLKNITFYGFVKYFFIKFCSVQSISLTLQKLHKNVQYCNGKTDGRRGKATIDVFATKYLSPFSPLKKKHFTGYRHNVACRGLYFYLLNT